MPSKKSANTASPRRGYWSPSENTKVWPTAWQLQRRKATQLNISALPQQQRAETWHKIKANNPALAELLTEVGFLVKAFDAQVIIDIKDLDP